jgi:hypothetical protein
MINEIAVLGEACRQGWSGVRCIVDRAAYETELNIYSENLKQRPCYKHKRLQKIDRYSKNIHQQLVNTPLTIV